MRPCRPLGTHTGERSTALIRALLSSMPTEGPGAGWQRLRGAAGRALPGYSVPGSVTLGSVLTWEKLAAQGPPRHTAWCQWVWSGPCTQAASLWVQAVMPSAGWVHVPIRKPPSLAGGHCLSPPVLTGARTSRPAGRSGGPSPRGSCSPGPRHPGWTGWSSASPSRSPPPRSRK